MTKIGETQNSQKQASVIQKIKNRDPQKQDLTKTRVAAKKVKIHPGPPEVSVGGGSKRQRKKISKSSQKAATAPEGRESATLKQKRQKNE